MDHPGYFMVFSPLLKGISSSLLSLGFISLSNSSLSNPSILKCHEINYTIFFIFSVNQFHVKGLQLACVVKSTLP